MDAPTSSLFPLNRPAGDTGGDGAGAGLISGFRADTLLRPFSPLSPIPSDQDGDGGQCQRQHPRAVAPPCRPVLVRLVDREQLRLTPWVYADLLDISVGGLCLLITESLDLHVGMDMAVDFKDHQPQQFAPGLPGSRLATTVRWYVAAGFVTTLGLGFHTPLDELPTLLPERRHRLREVNPSQDAA
jgi:hypothetical protein